jgi:hypothetical protein
MALRWYTKLYVLWKLGVLGQVSPVDLSLQSADLRKRDRLQG